MTTPEMVRKFADATNGHQVRGQFVEHVGIEIDTMLGDDGEFELRYLVSVYFAENPIDEASPEMTMLRRVFSEIPAFAVYVTYEYSEAVQILTGDIELSAVEWRLADELTIEPRT